MILLATVVLDSIALLFLLISIYYNTKAECCWKTAHWYDSGQPGTKPRAVRIYERLWSK